MSNPMWIEVINAAWPVVGPVLLAVLLVALVREIRATFER